MQAKKNPCAKWHSHYCKKSSWMWECTHSQFRYESVHRSAGAWLITGQTLIARLFSHRNLSACVFLCPEGQRGAEGGDRLADSPADVLGDHRQHVLLWRWVSWAWAATLTPAGHSAFTFVSSIRLSNALKTKQSIKNRHMYIWGMRLTIIFVID